MNVDEVIAGAKEIMFGEPLHIVTGAVIEIVPTEVHKHEAGYWRKMIDRKIEEAKGNGNQ